MTVRKSATNKVVVRRKKTSATTERAIAPSGYGKFLTSLKKHIRGAQLNAAATLHRELTQLYWRIGSEILLRQEKEGWGTKVVDRLAHDLEIAFPEMTGFSRSNLLYMRAFAEAYPDRKPIEQFVMQLPWAHNMVLLDKLKRPEERLWYAKATVQFGWSRSVLALQIKAKAHKKHGKAITNFKQTLAPEHSDLAHQTLKDPYTFDFLTIAADAPERDLENGLVDHIQKFLLSLGVGFAFVGRQFHLEIDGDDYYIDLLFYHLRMRCYFVIDLKMREFKPEFVSKIGFYLSAVDDQFRYMDDKPTLGLLLCKGAKKLTVEYALRGTNQPIGVSEWNTKLVASLPKKFQKMLPSTAEIEQELVSKRRRRTKK
ncbi:MAG: DUF1016 family protein [Flavobacteriales bacterium]|nr:DUF1016 family protein [Flavobacteriales bacterium]